MNSKIYEKLTDEQITNILYSEHGTLAVLDKRYYYKQCGKTKINNIKIDVTGIELLMEKLAHEVDISCAHYELLEIGNNHYTISENIGSDFVNARNKGFDCHSIYTILNILNREKYQDISNIMFDIVKMYLFDLLFLNGDRSCTNWGMTSDNKIHILDNQFCFDSSYPPQITAHYNDDYYASKGQFMAMYGDVSNASTEDTFLEELSYFINVTGREYYDLFIDMYNKLTPDLMKKKIIEVEKQNNMKLPDLYILLDIYKKHYDNIYKLLENKKKRK